MAASLSSVPSATCYTTRRPTIWRRFVRGKIREIVRNPGRRAALPRNVIGCKRLCVDTGYWATHNQPNVTLIAVSGEPIEAITPAGIRAKGQEYRS
jgi:cyclohexanone monooxygenase